MQVLEPGMQVREAGEGMIPVSGCGPSNVTVHSPGESRIGDDARLARAHDHLRWFDLVTDQRCNQEVESINTVKPLQGIQEPALAVLTVIRINRSMTFAPATDSLCSAGPNRRHLPDAGRPGFSFFRRHRTGSTNAGGPSDTLLNTSPRQISHVEEKTFTCIGRSKEGVFCCKRSNKTTYFSASLPNVPVQVSSDTRSSRSPLVDGRTRHGRR